MPPQHILRIFFCAQHARNVLKGGEILSLQTFYLKNGFIFFLRALRAAQDGAQVLLKSPLQRLNFRLQGRRIVIR